MSDIRIETLVDAVKKSQLQGAVKDYLSDQLQYAASINGSTDPVLQGMKKITIANVRQELSMHELMHQLVKDHEERFHAKQLKAERDDEEQEGNPIARFIKRNPILSAIVIASICGIVIGRWGLSAAVVLLTQVFGIGVSPVG